MRFFPSLSLSCPLNRRFIIVAILLLFSGLTTISPCLASAAATQEKESRLRQSTEEKEKELILDRDVAQLTPKTTELAKKLLDMQGQLNVTWSSKKGHFS